ncbi:uncharacterized protein LOC123298702 [Chrysoperla carnea]|uniref:uncharacterized protein LOC123298702 n=1 Tax=Chrysoperla carnea TaxID=189513 RepID=UPI001D0810E6|nr:uncharacterized protein LOC123298702 [Chrysoperla carnea]
MFSIINKCTTLVFVVGLLVVYFQGTDSAPMDGMMDKMCTMNMMQSDPTGMKGKLCGNTMSPESDDSVTIAPEGMQQNDINEEFKQNDINEEFKQNDINEEIKGMMQQMMGGMGGMGGMGM